MEQEGATPAFGGGSKTTGSSGPTKTFQQIKALMSEDLVKSIGGIFQFNLSGMWNDSFGLVILHILSV